MAAMMMVVLACSIPGTPAPAPAVTEPPATQAPSVTQTPVPVLPASPPDLPVLTNPSLTALDMLDSLNGWGTTETSLVRTLDGGLTWYDITPPGAGSLGYPASVFFLDPATGWVVMAGSDFMTGTLAYTIDGGFSWTLVAVPFAGGQIDFLNATTGFILVGRGSRFFGCGCVFQRGWGCHLDSGVYHATWRRGRCEYLTVQWTEKWHHLFRQSAWLGGGQYSHGRVCLFICQFRWRPCLEQTGCKPAC